jgi:hypothetical protein
MHALAALALRRIFARVQLANKPSLSLSVGTLPLSSLTAQLPCLLGLRESDRGEPGL